VSGRELTLAFKGFPVRCPHYKPDEYQQEFTVTTVIVPIRAVDNGREAKVSWACSRGKWCYADCAYAVARQRRGAEEWQQT